MLNARNIALVAVFALAGVIYGFGLRNELVFDDVRLLEQEFRAMYGGALSFKQRILSYGSFFWLEQLFSAAVWKQRLGNLALHLAVVGALFGFYRTLLSSIQQGNEPAVAGRNDDVVLLIAIAFFALNPVAVYAVGYLIQRSILMATLGVVLALWSFTLGLADGRKRYFAIALIAYLAALASKEHALLAPLCAVAIYALVRRPTWRELLRIGALGAGVAALAIAAFYVIYGRIIGTAFDELSIEFLNELNRLAPGTRERAWPLSIFNQLHLFTQYGLRWAFPYPGWLSIDLRPPFPLGFLSFPHLVGAIAYVGTAAGGWWLLRRHRDMRALLGLSLLFPVIMFATEFATVWVQDPFALYRSYLWAIGIPGVVIWAVHGLPRKALFATLFIVVALLSAGLFQRILSLSTPLTAWGDAIAALPDDPRAVGRWRPYLNRGEVYFDKGMTDLAMRDFDAADALGDTGSGRFNSGVALYTLKQYPAALEAFALAEKKGFAIPSLHYQRGLTLMALGRSKEAYSAFDAAIQHKISPPSYWSALAQRGTLAVDLGDPAAAIRDLDQAIPNMQEGSAFAKTALGLALAQRGEAARAVTVLTEAMEKAPSVPALYARAYAHLQLKDRKAALADIERAAGTEPNNVALRSLHEKILALP